MSGEYNIICKFFKGAGCKYGKSCKFSHNPNYISPNQSEDENSRPNSSMSTCVSEPEEGTGTNDENELTEDELEDEKAGNNDIQSKESEYIAQLLSRDNAIVHLHHQIRKLTNKIKKLQKKNKPCKCPSILERKTKKKISSSCSLNEENEETNYEESYTEEAEAVQEQNQVITNSNTVEIIEESLTHADQQSDRQQRVQVRLNESHNFYNIPRRAGTSYNVESSDCNVRRQEQVREITPEYLQDNSRITDNLQDRDRPECCYYLYGQCWFGQRCWNRHIRGRLGICGRETVREEMETMNLIDRINRDRCELARRGMCVVEQQVVQSINNIIPRDPVVHEDGRFH